MAKTTRKAKKASPTNQRVAGDNRLEMLITVVNRSKAEFYMDLLQSFHINMQWIALGQGTATAEILRSLRMVSQDKAVIFSIIRHDHVQEALSALADKFNTIKNGKGVAYTIPLSGIIGVAAWGFVADNRKTVKEDNQ